MYQHNLSLQEKYDRMSANEIRFDEYKVDDAIL